MHRNPKSKYYVTREEYAGDAWPRSCNGGFYASRVDTIGQIWRQAGREKPVRMDDVWVTGVLRRKRGIPDSCVVDMKADTLHLWGYRGGEEPAYEGFLERQWVKFSREIRKRPHCFCVLS